MTITVESGSDVQLSSSGQQGKQLTLPEGDVDLSMSWNFQGELQNSTATVTIAAEGKTSSATVDLIVDKTVRYVEFQDIGDVMHLAKTPVRVEVYDCSSWGPSPLLDGRTVDLEITEGLEYGNLLDPKTGQHGKKLTAVQSQDGFVEVQYYANGIYPPDRWEGVRIRATSGEAEDQNVLYVFAGDLIVTVDKPEIYFGEATGVTLQVRNWDLSISPVPQGWPTMYQIVEADTIGYFQSPDGSKTGSPLIGQYPEATFHAKSYSTPPDSVVVVINCVAVDPNGGGGVAKIVDGGHPIKGHPTTKSLADSNNSGGAKIVDHGRPIKAQPITKFLKNAKTSSKSIDGKKNRVMDEPPNLGDGYYYYGMAQVVVKKECEVQKSQDAITVINSTMFKITRLDNGFNCREGVGGYTAPYGYAFRIGDPKFYKGTMSLTGLDLLITWGVCDHGAARVDDTFSNITSQNEAMELRVVLDSFDENSGPVEQPYCYVPAAEAHEAIHMPQAESVLTGEYNKALVEINNDEAIKDWCKMTEEGLLLAQIQKTKRISDILSQARDRSDKIMTGNEFGTEAYKAGYEKAQEARVRITKLFNLPE
jgi:hypothetical protein